MVVVKAVMEEELMKPAAVEVLVVVEVKAAVELLATVKKVLAAVEDMLTRLEKVLADVEVDKAEEEEQEIEEAEDEVEGVEEVDEMEEAERGGRGERGGNGESGGHGERGGRGEGGGHGERGGPGVRGRRGVRGGREGRGGCGGVADETEKTKHLQLLLTAFITCWCALIPRLAQRSQIIWLLITVPVPLLLRAFYICRRGGIIGYEQKSMKQVNKNILYEKVGGI